MSDFEIKPNRYTDLPRFLVTTVRGFRESPEFAEVAEFENLPGVVLGAIRPYLERLQKGALTTLNDRGEEDALSSIYDALERLAESRDPAIENALVVEVFEVLDGGETVLAEIERRLHPRSRELYERWTRAD